MTRKQINRIFYIYTEATAAVFLAGCSIVELMCFFVVPEFFQPLAATSAAAFAAMTAACIRKIYNEEKNA